MRSYLKVKACTHCSWIIGIYLHEFTNNVREISIPHKAAEEIKFTPRLLHHDNDVKKVISS